MKLIRRVILVIIAVPIISWAFFRFVYYPVEIERHNHGDYTLIVYAEPTQLVCHPVQLFFEALIVFGSIENNTQVRVALVKNHKGINSAVLATGEDLYQDHVPLSVVWLNNSVVVSEAKRGTTKTLGFQPAH